MDKIFRILQVIAPVFIMWSAGYCFQKYRALDRKTLSTLGLFLFGPCLVFSKLSRIQIAPSEVGRVVISFFLLVAALYVVARVLGTVMGLDARLMSPFLMGALFPNAGNFGFPVNYFAFGDKGLELAAVFLIGSVFTQNSLAVFLAARSEHKLKDSLFRTLRMPTPYVVILAGIYRCFDSIQMSDENVIMRSIDTLGDAMIPCTLVLLGMQIASSKTNMMSKTPPVMFLRLILSPIIAYFITEMLGLQPLAQKVFIVQAAMPTAVNMTVIAIQLGVDARYISNIVLWTTLTSIGSLSVVLWLVM